MTARHPQPETLTAWLDETLEAPQAASVAEHVAQCAECKQASDEEAWIKRVLAEAATGPEPLPEGLENRIFGALHALPEEPRAASEVARALAGAPVKASRWRFSWISGGLGAAIAAVLFAVVLPRSTPLPRIETAAVQVQQNAAVSIGFDVAQSVENVTYEITLPEGLRFVGEDSQPVGGQSVTWQGALREGKTVVPIVVRGMRPGTYEILATVRKGPMMKQTTIVVPVTGEDS